MALLAVYVMMLAVNVRAQSPQDTMKPGPEVKKLAYNIGTWNLEHEDRPFGAMKGGKFKATEKCEWYSGGFFVTCRWEGTGPAGPSRGVSFLGYDRAQKVYTFHGFESSGDVIDARGTFDGTTWHWASATTMGDAKTAALITIKNVSPTEYTFTMELSQDGKEFSVVRQSTARKAAQAPAAKKP